MKTTTTHSRPRRSSNKRAGPTTRVSIENSPTWATSQIKPRLKSGVLISRPAVDKEKSLIIGIGQKAISISHPGARAIVSKFDGQHSAIEISEEINAPIEVVEKVITQLVIAQMLDLTKSKIKLHNRFQSPIAQRAIQTEDQSNDAFFRQLQIRMAPELSQTTWIENILDGGVERLSARQDFGIEIHGNNRLATIIFVGLLASGVSNTRFSIQSRRSNYSVGDCDLGTGILRTNDFGLNYKNRMEELSREWSLFPTAPKNLNEATKKVIPEKNLRIIVGNFQPELITQLMIDKLDHFFVGGLAGAAAQCGPLVIPKKSPCYGCIELIHSDQYGVEPLIPLHPLNDEPPVAIAYQIAGVAIQTVLQFIDTGTSELIASRLSFDYLNTAKREQIRFPRHPRCGCSWE